MTNLLILVAIVLLVIILILLLRTTNESQTPKEQIIAHNLTDEEVDSVNNELLQGGKFRIDIGDGKTARLFTFIDVLLLDLNSSNNDLILDHQKNIDTVNFLINLPDKIDPISKETNQLLLAREETFETDPIILKQLKGGTTFTIEQVGKQDICPPPTGGGGGGGGRTATEEEKARYLWNPKAAAYVMNFSQNLTTNVYLTDPVGVRLLPKVTDGLLYSFEEALKNNFRSGFHTVTFVINDLETNKQAMFEQVILI